MNTQTAQYIPSLRGYALSAALRNDAQDCASHPRAQLMETAAMEIDALVRETRAAASAPALVEALQKIIRDCASPCKAIRTPGDLAAEIAAAALRSAGVEQ